MNEQAVVSDAAAKARKRKKSMFVQTVKRLVKNKVSLIGFIILFIIILAVILADVLAPCDPEYMDYGAIHALPSAAHPFGTDNLGRDILSRLLVGGRYSLSLGFICAFVSLFVGVFFGNLVGYLGGRVDMVVMRLCDIFGAIPGQLLAIVISTALGSGFINTILAMTVGGFPNAIRGNRALALKEREMEYLEAARAMNCSKMKIVFKHMMPNTIPIQIVGTTMSIGHAIIGAAGLSFIGLGIQLPTPEWGAILSGSRKYVMDYPHEMLFPGLAILITVLAINMIGDGLRDALDPKLKN
ncbi:MAG: ABC transporter permease [Lachnospiraceae bacterium]|nr:ABC transporter permease [Lachnospiraceae bacterium]